MWCCSRNVKTINENFESIEEDLRSFRHKIEDVIDDMERLKEKHRQTKKNLVKIIDTFTLNEYVLFKTRLLTKKQSLDLIENIYNHYKYPIEYRDEKGIETFENIIYSEEKPLNFNLEYTKNVLSTLKEVQSFKKILNKLEEPKLKDSKYEELKMEWCLKDNSEFMEVIIKCLKMN